jgi:hypothetical protein
MGNYHPISTKIGTQTQKNILSSKVTKAEVTDRFQDGRGRHVGKSSACYKVGNYHRTLMKIGTQTKQNRLSSKVIEAEAYGKKQQKLNVKRRHRFKKVTLYEREVIKKQKFFIRWQKLPYSYNMWLDNHSLNFLIKLKLWCMRVFQASSVIEILIHVYGKGN